jgi:hypothetical protein
LTPISSSRMRSTSGVLVPNLRTAASFRGFFSCTPPPTSLPRGTVAHNSRQRGRRSGGRWHTCCIHAAYIHRKSARRCSYLAEPVEINICVLLGKLPLGRCVTSRNLALDVHALMHLRSNARSRGGQHEHNVRGGRGGVCTEQYGSRCNAGNGSVGARSPCLAQGGEADALLWTRRQHCRHSSRRGSGLGVRHLRRRGAVEVRLCRCAQKLLWHRKRRHCQRCSALVLGRAFFRALSFSFAPYSKNVFSVVRFSFFHRVFRPKLDASKQHGHAQARSGCECLSAAAAGGGDHGAQ